MSKESNSQKENYNPNAYLKYSGMVMQLLVLLFLAAYLGEKIDGSMGNETPYITALLVLIAVVAYLFKIYFDLSKTP